VGHAVVMAVLDGGHHLAEHIPGGRGEGRVGKWEGWEWEGGWVEQRSGRGEANRGSAAIIFSS
jgi:hypothetical protein